MSYANATVSPAARLRAASGVIAIHALIGAGVVIGLTITEVITEEDDGLVAIFRPENVPPPPPPETIPEPAEQAFAPVTAPQPPIPLERTAPIEVEPVQPNIPDTVVRVAPPRPLEIPVTPPALPAQPAFDPIGAVPRNGPAGWITTNDYARSDLVRNREGTGSYRLIVGSDGRVDACEITRTTGHASLDRSTCRLIERRARFDPAKNNRGESVVGTYSGTITWQIPD